MKKNLIIWGAISLAGMLVGIVFYSLSVGGFIFSDSATQIMSWINNGGWYNLITPIVLLLLALILFVILIVKKRPIYVLVFLLIVVGATVSTVLSAQEASYIEGVSIAQIEPYIWVSFSGFLVCELSCLVMGLLSILYIISVKKEDAPVHEYATSENSIPVSENKPTFKEVVKHEPEPTKYEYNGEDEQETKAVDKAVAKQKKASKVASDPSRIYHIAKRASDNKWTVKFEGGNKVIKLFDTQVEAKEYVNKMAENQGGSVRVHNSKGANKGKFQTK